MKFGSSHLSYCTNIHPAETWDETRTMLATHVLAVRDRLRASGQLGADEAFAIGLRLSAVAARELLEGDHLARFREWLAATIRFRTGRHRRQRPRSWLETPQAEVEDVPSLRAALWPMLQIS